MGAAGGGGGYIPPKGGNKAPTVTNPIGDKIINENDTFTFTIPSNTFTDGDVLTYSTSTLPSWLIFDASTGRFSGTPDNNDIGGYDIVVTASDGSLSTSDTFTITVNDVNNEPVLTNPIEDVFYDNQDPVPEEKYRTEFPSNTFTDPDNDVLTYSSVLTVSDS